MPLTIYSAPESRGSIAEWFVKELDVPHEIKFLDLKKKEQKSPWFLKLNPFHRVPVLEDGDFVLYESGAILLYLQNECAGPLTSKDLGLVSQWVLFGNSTVNDAMYTQEKAETLLSELDPVLEGKDYLVGRGFTAADVAVTSYILYMPMMLPELKLSKWPNVHRYTSAIAQRDACPYKAWIQKEDDGGAATTAEASA
eukprot:jgi/Botrbrau1/15036/Bobra.320_2s0010.1